MKAKPASPIPAAILVRVSTAKQETARQVSELRAVAEAKGWAVVAVCEELAVSGRADESERHGLRQVEELARAGKIKKVMVHEVSRVARRNSIVHRFVETLEELGVSLYWHAQGIETMMANGKRNPAASIMLALLAEMARNETETLRERINSGLANARKNGTKKGNPFGRPKGSGLKPAALLEKHSAIVKRLKEGHSIRDTARLVNGLTKEGNPRGVSTVQRVKAALDA